MSGILNETSKSPIRRQFFHYVEATGVSNNLIVEQVLLELGDLGKLLTLHDHKCFEEGMT